MDPFLFVYTALVGFFAFAGVYHAILWWSSRRDWLLAAFSADCLLRAALCAALAALVTVKTPSPAFHLSSIRIGIVFVTTVTSLWCVRLISGVRADWFVWPLTVTILLIFTIHVSLAPLNTEVVEVEQLEMPWGEAVSNPRLGRPGWWVGPLLLLAFAAQAFGLYCGARLLPRDPVAGACVLAACLGTVVVFVLEGLRNFQIIALPNIGAFPNTLWVCLIALLIARGHRQTRDQLQASEQRFRTIGEQASDGIFLTDAAGRYLDVNAAGCAMLGYGRDEVLARTLSDVLVPADAGRVGPELESLRGGPPLRTEWRFRRKDGTQFTGEVHARMLPDSRLLGVVRDTTERSTAENALRDSEARLNAVIQNSPGVAVQWYDAGGRVVLWNLASETMFGYPARDAVGKTLDELIHTPEEFRQFLAALTTARRSSEPTRPTEYTFRRRNGEAGVCLSTLFRVPGPNDADWFVCMDVDITERKLAEETIRQLLDGVSPRTGPDFFQTLANTLSRACRVDYAFVAATAPPDDSKARTIAVSHRGSAAANFAYGLAKTPCENVVGEEFCFHPSKVREAFADDAMLAELAVDSYMGIPLISSGGRALGLIALLHTDRMPLPQHAETMLRVVAPRVAAELERELSEAARREAEHSLRERETFLRLAQEAAHVGSWEWDIGENRFKWSDELARIHGIRAADFDGELRTVLSFCHPEDTQKLRMAMTAATSGGEIRAFEYRICRRDGAPRDLWLLGQVIRDEHDLPAKVLGVGIDITERKSAEEKRRVLESQLSQAQKMEAVGMLASGIAHDFNNLLTVISGYSELLLSLLPPQDEKAEMVSGIQEAGQRAASLTRQLLTFSRKQVVEPLAIDLNEVVAETEKMLRRLIGEDIHLVTVLKSGLSHVMADPGQVGQVILNLAVNARDAMPTGGRLTIETQDVPVDEAFAAVRPEARPGKYVLLAVTDTGCGLTPEVQGRIFEPFFTTKGPGKGTGLGLATVRTIAEQSGGFLSVYSEPGRGSTFKIYLPALSDSAVTERPSRVGRLTPRGDETVLLVEDEAAVRALTSRILQQYGYAVVEASGGSEAIELVERHPAAVDLVITDVVMPEMGCQQLVERLKAIRADLKILYLSGYTDDTVVRHGVLQADVAFLQKPFTVDGLVSKVRQTLDQPFAGAAG